MAIKSKRIRSVAAAVLSLGLLAGVGVQTAQAFGGQDGNKNRVGIWYYDWHYSMASVTPIGNSRATAAAWQDKNTPYYIKATWGGGKAGRYYMVEVSGRDAYRNDGAYITG